MRPTTARRQIGWTAIALAIGLTGAAATADDDREKVHEIHDEVEIRIDCRGDDCGEAERRVIVLGEDGEVERAGPGHVWIDVDPDVEERFTRRMRVGRKGGFLGVGLTELTPELRVHFGVPEEVGVMVSKVVDDSPAQRAGIRVGDVVTLVDGEPIASANELSREIGSRGDGEAVTVEVWRDGRAQQITAAVEERERMRLGPMPRFHMLHGDGERIGRRVVVRCDDEGDDCAIDLGDFAGDLDLDCDSARCRVEVVCEDGDCECTIDGEAADCAQIPGVPSD